MIVEDSIDKLIEHLPKDLHTMKVIEECAELQEVLIKSLTKSEGFKPKKEKIVEEMGDVMYRIMVLIQVLEVEDEVEKRIEEKSQHLYDWAVNKFEKNKV